MRVAVVGASGFIGHRLVETLASEAAHDVVAVVRSKPMLEIARVVYRAMADLQMLDAAAHPFAGCEAIVYAAGHSVPGAFERDAARYFSDEAASLMTVAQSMLRVGVDRIVYLSSGGTVYGEGAGRAHEERDLLQPKSLYGISKVTCESLLHAFAASQGLAPVILRLSNCYGPGQRPGRGQGVVATFAASIANGRTVEIWGDGSEVRDYVFIDDAIAGILAAIGYRGASRVFNLGSGRGVSVREVVDAMARTLSRPAVVATRSRVDGAVLHNVLDCARAARELSWHATTEFEAGLRCTLSQMKLG